MQGLECLYIHDEKRGCGKSVIGLADHVIPRILTVTVPCLSQVCLDNSLLSFKTGEVRGMV